MSRDTTPGHQASAGSSLTPNPNNYNSPTIAQISRPFFTSREISYLHGQTIPTLLKLQYGSTKSQIYTFLSQAVKSLKFPLRVLATAMNYYQRYYLFNKFDVSGVTASTTSSPNQFEGDPWIIAITCLFLSSKVEDCVKKLKDIQQVCNKIRDIDDSQLVSSGGPYLDYQRKYILQLEFKLLQICKFDFNNGNNPGFSTSVDDIMIQFCKQLDVSYKVSFLSWLMVYDIIQTPLSLNVPPHCVALAIIIISLNLNPSDMILKQHATDLADEASENEKMSSILSSIDSADFNCPTLLVNEAIVYILDYYTHQYEYSVLTRYLPEIDTETGKSQTFKFMELKSRFNDVEPMNDESCFNELNSADEYLELWDHNTPIKGSARFMLSSKRRRFNEENMHVRKQQQQQQQQQQSKAN
ncbi:uncharacterized protein LODBEIA_P27230 [Lodderomyces beijingensis]|uniref:Cyclin-like domain-containing protein n=1 Tax=Lodderomyces beijingensis TaxID=1775926 RepID=A0ABP0ZK23_9ASCO